jgi:hypothetical protein
MIFELVCGDYDRASARPELLLEQVVGTLLHLGSLKACAREADQAMQVDWGDCDHVRR